MPRFQLLVRELGKEPRVVPLADPIVIGRSRSVDLTVDDEEVGRKQFRIGVNSGFVVLEGIGATNPTRVDDSVLSAGEKTTVPAGATIRVGKTSFVVESADKTDSLPPGPAEPMPEGTMVSPGPVGGPAGPSANPPAADAVPEGTMLQPGPGPGRPGAPAAPADPAPPAGEGTGGFGGPMNTMEVRRPGAPIPGGPAADRPTPGPTPGGSAPGSPAAAGSPPATPDETSAGGNPGGGGDYGQTMAKGFRPGAFRPGGDPVPAAPQPAPTPAPKPASPPPAPPQARPTPAAPPPPPPAAAPAPPTPAAPAAPQPPLATPPMPPPAAGVPPRPKTVAVRPEQMAPPPSTVGGQADDLESRLHQSMPRLFVKSEGLKRRVRLMKASNKIGRAETADILLPHESVSEAHAELRFDGAQWTLLDSGSTNGSVVDGQHLRGTETAVGRNSLIGIGSLHIIFLCVDPRREAQDRRDEDRALQQLVRDGRVTKDEAAQIRRLTRDDSHQSIAEVLLMETALGPLDWANAVATARSKVGLLDRILALFSFSKR